MKLPALRAILLVLCLPLASLPAHADCGAAAPTPHCGAAPSLQFDADGGLWAVFASGEHVWLSHSRGPNAPWESAVRVNAEPEALFAEGENRPVLALGANRAVFVAWTRRTGGPYDGDIRFTRSLDGGASFEPVRTVNDDGLLTSHRFVSMAQGGNGDLYLAWLDKRDQVAALARGEDYVGAALYYTLSRDSGATFEANRKVADNSCECCRVALAAHGADAVVALWRHVFDGGTVRDHAIATLGAEHAYGFARASDDDWHLDGCPHHGPALAAVADGVHMAWFTNGSRRQGVVYGYRADASAATALVHVLDAQPAGGHPVVYAQEEDVSVLWTSYDGTALRLLRAHSTDGGQNWRAPREIMRSDGSADYPFIVRHANTAWVGWQTSSEGLRLLPLD